MVAALVLVSAIVYAARASGAPRRRAIAAIVTVLVIAGAVVALARLGQLDRVLVRIERASPWLLALAAALEGLSFTGYFVLTRTVFEPVCPRIDWRASVQITLAGVVATRLVASGGAGGIALTVWALRAAGMEARAAARRLSAFLVLVYAVFFAALFVSGLACAALHSAPVSLALSGAGVGAAVGALAIAVLKAPGDVERRVRRLASGGSRRARLARRLATVPAVAHEALEDALEVARRDPLTTAAGGLAWWGFDVAVLAVTFAVFGSIPPLGVLVLCYFVGHLAQTIPIPGGVGPVEGGMIGAFVACGVSTDLAVIAVLSYQAVSVWLPVAPGLVAYWRLRRTMTAWARADAPAEAAA